MSPLQEAVAELTAALAVAKTDLEELYPDSHPYQMRDMNNRYLLLDGMAALVNGLAALERAK